MSARQTAADLRAAAQHIIDHGWAQGVSRSPDGSMCAQTAIHAALRDVEPVGTKMMRRGLVVEALREQIGKQIGKPDIPAWNDAEGRTLDDVLNAFEKAAIAVEERA